MIPTAPPAPELNSDPVEVLEHHHREGDLQIDALTGFPRWDGEGFDLGYAIEALRSALSSDSAASDTDRSMPRDHDSFDPSQEESPLDVSAETFPVDWRVSARSALKLLGGDKSAPARCGSAQLPRTPCRFHDRFDQSHP